MLNNGWMLTRSLNAAMAHEVSILRRLRGEKEIRFDQIPGSER